MKILKKTSKVKSVAISFSTKVDTDRLDGNTIFIKIPKEKQDIFSVRKTLRRTVRFAINLKITTISFSISELDKLKLKNKISDINEIVGYEFVLAGYEFDKYKTKKKGEYAGLQTVYIDAKDKDFALVKHGSDLAQIVNKARDVINTPAKDMSSSDFVSLVKSEIARTKKVSLKVLGKKEILKEKMGAYMAVAQASNTEPKMIVLRYDGAGKKERPIVFIGKGVMYDTGGLGLKPAEFMNDMHMDMAGATVAFYTFLSLAKKRVKKNIVAIMPTAENAIGSKSYRNGDIVRAKDGTYIEIGHTDAEGRLLLADAIVYAQEKFNPAKIIDIATLTGAAIVALGEHSSAVFARQEKHYKELLQSSDKTGVRIWPLPLFGEYDEEIKSKVADITNSAKTRYGGAITAAAFLKHFVGEEQNWAHIDIAPRMMATKQDQLAFGATGEPIALLVKTFEQ